MAELLVRLRLVAAHLCLARYQDERRFRLARTLREGVQQAENAGIRQRDSEGNRSGDGEGDYKSNQQASQVLPTSPSDPAARSTDSIPAHRFEGAHSFALRERTGLPVRFHSTRVDACRC